MLPAIVIGCGKIGSQLDQCNFTFLPKTHAGAYSICSATHLSALCDSNDKLLTSESLKWNVAKGFSDYSAAIREVNPVIVSVATPDATHAAICLDVIRHPSVQVVIVEKPLAMTSAEARSVRDHAENRGITLLVNYSRRFSNVFQSVRHELRKGVLGPIQHVSGYYSKGILHNGSHWLDLVSWLVGDFSVLNATEVAREIPGDPTLSLNLQFNCGASGTLTGVNQSHFFLFELDIIATLGRLSITQGPRFQWFEVLPSAEYPRFKFLQPTKTEIGDNESPMLSLVQNAVDCVQSGAVPLCSGIDAIRAIEHAEHAIELCKK